MEFLKSQFARLQQQFNLLTATQKMLAVSLVAIMAMTAVWWGHYANTAEFEPLLSQDIPIEDFGRIEAHLRAKGIAFQTVGSRILVPADRKYAIGAELMLEQLMPRDFSNSFEEVLKSGGTFDPPEKTAVLHNHLKERELAQYIRNFPRVANANVTIDNTTKRAFENSVTPSATVVIAMKSGAKADNRMVSAAADSICGGVAGMARSRVKVIVDGVSRFYGSDDGSDGAVGGSGGKLDQIREAEKYHADKVISQLSYCEGVLVSVQVTTKDELTNEETVKFLSPISAVTEDENESKNNTGPTMVGGEPGLALNTGTNTGMAVTKSASTISESQAGSQVNERARTKSESKFGSTTTVKKSTPSAPTVTSCSVAMPRSYFTGVYKKIKGADKEPSEVALADLMKQELENARSQVMKALNLADEKSLVVTSYVDLAPALAENASQSAGVSVMLGNHAKEIVLGTLALVSLFMVSGIVRKGAPTAGRQSGKSGGGRGMDDIPSVGSTVDAAMGVASKKSAPIVLPIEDDLAGEVGEGGKTLEGVELDDEAVRAQQVMDQVTTISKENPDVAAQMIKRWMTRN